VYMVSIKKGLLPYLYSLISGLITHFRKPQKPFLSRRPANGCKNSLHARILPFI
jgi:hypothetical protein